MEYSEHAVKRGQQRGISRDAADLIVEFGTRKRKPGGAWEYRLKKAEKEKLIRALKRLIRMIDRIDGKGVVVSEDDTVITTYHLQS